MLALGRGIGLGAAAVTLGLWGLFLSGRVYDMSIIRTGTYGVVYLMTAVALLGILAAWRAWPRVMLLVFFLSFVPMGFYLLGTPGIFFWIGVANIGFLASGILLLKGRKTQLPEL